MGIVGGKNRLDIKAADVSGAIFDDCNMSDWNAHNVNMSGFRVDNANLTALHISNANLAGASISSSQIEGMTIDGINVLNAIAAYRQKAE